MSQLPRYAAGFLVGMFVAVLLYAVHGDLDAPPTLPPRPPDCGKFERAVAQVEGQVVSAERRLHELEYAYRQLRILLQTRSGKSLRKAVKRALDATELEGANTPQ